MSTTPPPPESEPVSPEPSDGPTLSWPATAEVFEFSQPTMTISAATFHPSTAPHRFGCPAHTGETDRSLTERRRTCRVWHDFA